MRRLQIALSGLLVAFFLASCAPQTVPAPAPQKPAPAAAAPAPAAAPVAKAPAKPAWEAEWEKTLDAAKKEGSVLIRTTNTTGSLRMAFIKIAKTHGLSAEILTGRAAEILAKDRAERRAGLYLADIQITGLAPLIVNYKPAGFLERLDSALILPDLTDAEVVKKVWYQGKVPWVDKDHTTLILVLQPRLPIAINTTLVRPDEVKSWRDVLNPKWGGKVAFNDPTTPGTGQLAVQAMGGIMGESYVRELAAAKPIVMRDDRLLLDWLAHGKIAIIVAPLLEALVELMAAGAPIKGITPVEGTWISASGGGLAMYSKAPHPNAAKIFINTLITKEGQTDFAIAGGYQSTRLDVPISHLPVELTRAEGAKYFDAVSEEALLARPVTDKLAVELFTPLVK